MPLLIDLAIENRVFAARHAKTVAENTVERRDGKNSAGSEMEPLTPHGPARNSWAYARPKPPEAKRKLAADS